MKEKTRGCDTGKNGVTTTDTEEDYFSSAYNKKKQTLMYYNGITQLRLFVCSGM